MLCISGFVDDVMFARKRRRESRAWVGVQYIRLSCFDNCAPYSIAKPVTNKSSLLLLLFLIVTDVHDHYGHFA